MSTLATIPSPSFNSIDIGPLSLNIYGLAIALGVVAAVWLFGRRLEQRHAGTADDASAIAIWAVLAGVVGARLYHVATDWDRFVGNYGDIPKLWTGGLGIPGGLLLGIPVGLYMAHRRGIPLSIAATCAAPAIPLAQAIGRWGNYFNQELYGRATDLPWALEIDADHLVENPATGEMFAVGTTFHPTFLYESLWSLATVAVLLYIDRRWRPTGGSLMGLYLVAYGIGRFWVEGLRVDPADDVGPFRWNQWVALGMVVGGLALFLILRRHPDPPPNPALVDADDESHDGVDGVERDSEPDDATGPTATDEPSPGHDRPDDEHEASELDADDAR
ncbi:prolipoprotein diacylglyceryl transferase [Ilumatobacter nonamiensis]|uniref:prolipoprotein diacylglyceryl transferase n=1 Tax=Ilumatobacter nonamiensis TaxID=467093 RepID=UPI000346BD1C|nr:prolipoprotein diacylglyceryl transferase [Ilumatobacter nonamiensis]